MTEEEIMDELVGLAMDWALGEEPTGATSEMMIASTSRMGPIIP